MFAKIKINLIFFLRKSILKQIQFSVGYSLPKIYKGFSAEMALYPLLTRRASSPEAQVTLVCTAKNGQWAWKKIASHLFRLVSLRVAILQ